VATSSQGIGVTISGDFGDIDFEEVTSASIDGVQSDTVEVTPRTSTVRKKKFRPADADDGTASFVMRSRSGLTDSVVGQTCDLSVYKLGIGGESYWSGVAIIQSLAWRASVGELQEYSVTFKLGATT
jgi:hypothetical protein